MVLGFPRKWCQGGNELGRRLRSREKARMIPGWNWSSLSWQLGWVYCFGWFPSIFEALPHCLSAWQTRFAETPVSLQGQGGEAQELTGMGCHVPQWDTTPMACLGLALEYTPCPTPGALSSPKRVFPWAASCRNGQDSQLHACLCFSSLSCQGVINSRKKEGMLKKARVSQATSTIRNAEDEWAKSPI